MTDSIPNKSRVTIALMVTITLVSTAYSQDKPPEGFTNLINGKDFTGFQFVLREEGAAPGKTWSLTDGVITCTGEPYGYFYTQKSYGNFVLRYDWKYTRPKDLKDDSLFGGNSGLLIQIRGEHKVWPTCIEVQGMNRDHGNIFGLGVDFKVKKFDKEVQRKAIKPVGEWNTTEVTCQNGTITSKLNGIEICTGECMPEAGPIGWQSEGAEIHFRNLFIKELK